MTLLSMYNVTHNQWKQNAVYMFSSVPITLWLALLLIFVTYVIVDSIGLKLLNGSTSLTGIVWKITRALLNQPIFKPQNLFTSTAWAIASVALFFCTAYFCQTLRASMVVVEEPTAIKSYDEAIDRAIDVVIEKSWPEYSRMEQLSESSKEYQLFKKRNGKKVQDSTYSVIQQKSVIFGRDTVSKMYALILLIRSNDSRARALLIQDPNASRFMQVMIMNKKKNQIFRKIASESMMRAFDFGITNHETFHMPRRYVERMIGGMILPSLDRKVSAVVEMDEAELVPVSLRDSKLILILFNVGIIISTITLLAEKAIYQSRPLNKKRVRRFISQKPNLSAIQE